MNLITGATGLVGSHLALRLLEKGESVRAIYRSEQSIEKTKNLFCLYKSEKLFNSIEWFEADITDVPKLQQAFIGVDHVYHCAALISFDPKDEERMRKINIEGTANVVNLCLDFGVSKLCHVSSVAALGDLKEGETVIDEETEWNPEKHHSDYGISKYGAEMEIWRGWQEGLATVAVVPGIIIGPGFWGDGSGAMFTAIEKGFPFYTKGKTGFVSVTDVVSAMIALMQSEISGERFILIGEHLALRDAAFEIADALSVKRPSIQANRLLVKIAAVADWIASVFGKKRKLFPETVDALFRTRSFSNAKIRSAIDMEFLPIKIAIRQTVDVQKNN